MHELVLLASFSLALGACQRGYKTADDLEADARGPRACWEACKELGLEMSALVLVEHAASACVCAPPGRPAADRSAGATAGAAHVVLDQQQRQAPTSPATPPPTPAH